MQVEEVFESVRDDMEAVETVLHQEAKASRVPLLSAVGEHIVSGGGKRFRPLLTILSGRLCGTSLRKRIHLAASVELIHNGTLLHDDIIDEATIRRGKPAAHRLWGHTAGVLAGDLHFSRAFSLILEAGGLLALRVINQTMYAIVEGELLQFLNVGAGTLDEVRYREIIQRKTARLISAACKIGALPGSKGELVEPMAQYGLELGMAFQMTDDLLDYTAREQALGKRVGADFREGKLTLPLIAALSRSDSRDRRTLLEFLKATPEEREASFPRARELIARNEGFSTTYRAAMEHIERAVGLVSALPPTWERQALIELARFIVRRTH